MHVSWKSNFSGVVNVHKVAVKVNEKLSHITTTVYSAPTVHIYQLICLIVPSSWTKLLEYCYST